MDDQSVFPPYPYLVMSLTMVAVEVFAAILGNGFIVVVNILDWLRNKHLNPVDHILVVLALSNGGFSWIYGNYIFFKFMWPQFLLMDYAYPVAFAFLSFMAHSSMWLIAWLCLYFCFKIIHFKSSFLAKLKMSIDSSVVWIILISEVIVVSCSIPMIWSFHRPLNVKTAQNVTEIVTFNLDILYNILVIVPSSCFASFIVIVSLVCIIWSLCKHTHRMKKRIYPEDGSKLKTHQRAATTILSLLLIYILFYTAMVLISSVIPSNDFGILYWLTVCMLMCVSPALSVILILGNSKLWLALQKIWSYYVLKKPT